MKKFKVFLIILGLIITTACVSNQVKNDIDYEQFERYGRVLDINNYTVRMGISSDTHGAKRIYHIVFDYPYILNLNRHNQDDSNLTIQFMVDARNHIQFTALLPTIEKHKHEFGTHLDGRPLTPQYTVRFEVYDPTDTRTKVGQYHRSIYMRFPIVGPHITWYEPSPVKYENALQTMPRLYDLLMSFWVSEPVKRRGTFNTVENRDLGLYPFTP